VIDRRQTTDDRQTDHATEKCAVICGIDCAAKSDSPNNNDNQDHHGAVRS